MAKSGGDMQTEMEAPTKADLLLITSKIEG